MNALQTEIENRLAASEPDVEVLLAEVHGASTLRVFIDHPAGVTLELCERVSRELADLRERYALEVSSPGTERPLTKPAHYRRFVGRRARLRLRDAHGAAPTAGSQPRRSYTGELVGASDDAVTLAAAEGIVAIPYADISRGNLVAE